MTMSLQQWASNGWLKPHKTSAEEAANLLAIVCRDLKDAGRQAISDDWRFGIAYNAALKLCTILLYAEGYRPDKNLAHYRTLQALPLSLARNGKPMRCIWMPAARSGTLWSTTLSAG
jgi:hypothetical protein